MISLYRLKYVWVRTLCCTHKIISSEPARCMYVECILIVRRWLHVFIGSRRGHVKPGQPWNRQYHLMVLTHITKQLTKYVLIIYVYIHMPICIDVDADI